MGVTLDRPESKKRDSDRVSVDERLRAMPPQKATFIDKWASLPQQLKENLRPPRPRVEGTDEAQEKTMMIFDIRLPMLSILAGLLCLMVASFLSSDDRYRQTRTSNIDATVAALLSFLGCLCSAASSGRNHRHRARTGIRVLNECATVLGSLSCAWYTMMFEILQLGPAIRPTAVATVYAAAMVSGLDVFELTPERFETVVYVRVFFFVTAVLANLCGLVDYEHQGSEAPYAYPALALTSAVCLVVCVLIVATNAGSRECRWLPFRPQRRVLKIRDATLGNLFCFQESTKIVWVASAHKLFIVKCCVDTESGDVSVLNGLDSSDASKEAAAMVRSYLHASGLQTVLPPPGAHSDLEPAIQTLSNVKSSFGAMILYLACVLAYLYYGTNAPLAFAAVASGSMSFTSSTMWGWFIHGTAGGVKVREVDSLRSLLLLLAPAIDLAIPYETTHFERSLIALKVWAIILDGLWTTLRLSEQNDSMLLLKRGTDVSNCGGNSPDVMHGSYSLGDAAKATNSIRSMGKLEVYHSAVQTNNFPFSDARLFG